MLAVRTFVAQWWYSRYMKASSSSQKSLQSRALVGTALLFIVSSVLFGLLAALVTNGVTNTFDETVLLWINQHASPAFDTLFTIITQFGDAVFVTLASLVIILVLLFRKQPLKALFVAIGVGGAVLLSVILKPLFDRSRPDLWEWLVHETSLSFPSGHATASMALALCCVAVLWRTRFHVVSLVLAPLYVALIGLSRLYLGVHFPTDILGGWLLSLSWVSLIAFAYLFVAKTRAERLLE